MRIEKAKDNSQVWLIPFSDLMSVLVILFLALYGYSVSMKTDYELAMAAMRKDLGIVEAAKEMKDIGLTKKVQEDLKKQIQDGSLGVEVTTSKIKLTFASPVLFDSGSSTLKTSARDLLKSVAVNLKSMDNPVLVEGHTDAARMLGHKFRSNRELSLMRAFSVIDYLISEGLPPGKLTAYGYGEFRPVAPNDTDEGRAKNRRIEIIIMREETKNKES